MVAAFHVGSTEVVVVRSAQCCHSVAERFKRQRRVEAQSLNSNAAYGRIAELSCLNVVHQHAVNIHLVVHRIICTEAQMSRCEAIAHLRCEHVTVGIDHRNALRHVGILSELLLGKGIGSLHLKFAVLTNRVGICLCQSRSAAHSQQYYI